MEGRYQNRTAVFGPMTPTRPRAPRLQFRAPGQQFVYQARTPQGYNTSIELNPRQGYYYNEWNPRYYDPNQGYYRGRPSRVPFGAGYFRQQRYPRPALPPGPLDLSHKVVIPPPKEVVLVPNCNCERKVEYIICTGCGYLDETGITRARRGCNVHPKRFTYTDLAECPLCANDLKEHAVETME